MILMNIWLYDITIRWSIVAGGKNPHCLCTGKLEDFQLLYLITRGYVYIYTYSQYSHPEVESIWNFQYILTKWAYLWSLNIPYSILFQDDYVHIVFYVLYNIIHVSNTYIYVMYINVYWYIYILYAYRCTLNHPPKRGLWNWVCLYFITGMMHILALIFWLPRCLMAWNVPVLDRTTATCTKVKT